MGFIKICQLLNQAVATSSFTLELATVYVSNNTTDSYAPSTIPNVIIILPFKFLLISTNSKIHLYTKLLQIKPTGSKVNKVGAWQDLTMDYRALIINDYGSSIIYNLTKATLPTRNLM